MLSPEYLEQLPTAMVQLFGQQEEDIIIDMARRIAKTGTLTDTAEYQAYRLQELGAQRRYVMQRLSRITGKAKEELNAIFADAARTTLAYDNELFEQAGYSPDPLDENAELRQLVQAYRKQTSKLFFNLTQTTARTASKQFERALDRAAMQMTSGAFSYQQAIRTAVKSLAAKGVDTIVYRKNGHITQVTSTEVAVRRAVLTGVNQMASHVQLANAEQLGCDLVQVTAHGGARPEHAEWQGGIYSISGKHPKYKKLSTATGYGTGDGLCGWNCRHNFFPFFEGLSEPANTAKQLWDMEHATVTYNGQKMPLYEATQRQREIERNIRRWKREYLAMEAAGQDTTEAAVKLKKWRTIQADFCDKTGLRVDGFRGQVQGFGRSAASKATWGAKPFARFLKENTASGLNDLLPNYKEAVISSAKLSGYALNPEHPKGKDKAVAFRDALGYTIENESNLIAAIRSGLFKWKAIERSATQYGRRFEVKMLLRGPNGKQAAVKTAWQIDCGTEIPRLVSAYVYKDKGE